MCIPGGNDENKFSIDTENGNIVLAGALDWEQKTQYNLTIQASDGVNYAYTWVRTLCVRECVRVCSCAYYVSESVCVFSSRAT